MSVAVGSRRLLAGLLPDKLITSSSANKKILLQAADSISHLTIRETSGFEQAQVCSGRCRYHSGNISGNYWNLFFIRDCILQGRLRGY